MVIFHSYVSSPEGRCSPAQGNSWADSAFSSWYLATEMLGTHFFIAVLAGAQENIYRVYHGHHHGSNGPIYINNIYLWAFWYIGSHVISIGHGPNNHGRVRAEVYSFIVDVSFITDPVLPVAKKMPKSDLQKTGWFGFNPWFKKPPHLRFHRWVWVNTYRYIFSGMNIHKSQLFWGSPGVPGFWPIPRSQLGSTQEIVDDGVTLADPEIQRGSFFSLRHSMVEPDRKAFFRSPESFRSAVNVHLCVLFLCVCACAMHIYTIYIFRTFSIVTCIEQAILTMSEYHTKVGDPYVKDWNVFSGMYNEIPCQLVLQKAVVNRFHSCDGTFVHVLQ